MFWSVLAKKDKRAVKWGALGPRPRDEHWLPVTVLRARRGEVRVSKYTAIVSKQEHRARHFRARVCIASVLERLWGMSCGQSGGQLFLDLGGRKGVRLSGV